VRRPGTRKPPGKISSSWVSSPSGAPAQEFRRRGALDDQELRSRLDRHARALAAAADSLGLDLPDLLADLGGPDEDSPASSPGGGG